MSRNDPYFSFKDRDSAEYKPQYGTAYTPRQEKILSGELPLEDIRPNELSLLKQKAKHLGDMEGYEIATLRYTRAYPYVSRIVGPDPKYRFARKFLQYQWPPKTPKGRRFDVELPGDGVYEVGIKRWNADKTLLLERQVYWLLLLDGNEYTIPKWQVLPLVEALRSGMLGA